VQINGDLRLVIPLRAAENGDVLAWAYHTPISTQVFDANYRTLAATKAAMFAQGPRYAYEVGAQIAGLRLRDEGRQDALMRGDVDPEGNPNDSGAGALLAEIQRLTMVVAPSPAGWEPTPVGMALQRGGLDPEDWREAESGIVFFTCLWFLTPRSRRPQIGGMAASVQRGSLTSLPLTEWIASLPRSIPDAGSPPTP